MSSRTHTEPTAEITNRLTDRTPTVLRLYDPEDDDCPEPETLGWMEGTITVFWATAESGLVDKYERALETGDKAAAADIRDRVFESATADADCETAETVELTYDGESLERIGVSSEEETGGAVIRYDGGDLDEERFRIRDSSDTLSEEYEFGVILAPPLLSEAERDASENVPLDVDASSMPTDPGAHVATLAPAALVIVSVDDRCEATTDIAHQVSDWEPETDDGCKPSVDELVAECEAQIEKLS
ncbi:hypothetical protein [Haloterrigena salinisoli]|uniref:hypothetical protein n=1 Tax=Haloterrigena salinisoli TaxID=3132747 RepID=UPI0030CE4471